MLKQPEWKVWLAHRDTIPAAAAYTYDDGVAVGVYLLATCPNTAPPGSAARSWRPPSPPTQTG